MMESWRMWFLQDKKIQRIQEEGEEEGFEVFLSDKKLY